MDSKIQDSTGAKDKVPVSAERVSEKRELRSSEKDSREKEPREKTSKSSTSKSKSKEDAILHQLSMINSKLESNDAALQELANRVSTFEEWPEGNYNDDEDSQAESPEVFLEDEFPDPVTRDITRDSFAAFLKGDKDVALVEPVGASSADAGDSSHILDIMRRNKPPSTFGPPLEESIAQLFGDIIAQQQDKKLLEGLKESYKLPENCKLMGSPRVNPELWAIMDKTSIGQDLEYRATQDIFSLNMTILAKAVQIINANRASLGDKFAVELMNLVSDATAASAYAFRDLNSRRRTAIKKTLPRDVAAACTAEMKTTELLFGDKFAENLKAARSAISLTKASSSQSRSKPRYLPYGDKSYHQRSRGSGHYHSQGASLNSNRPPQSWRGFRGGRGRGSAPQIHNNYNSSSNNNQLRGRD